jgi:hypothetical protein
LSGVKENKTRGFENPSLIFFQPSAPDAIAGSASIRWPGHHPRARPPAVDPAASRQPQARWTSSRGQQARAWTPAAGARLDASRRRAARTPTVGARWIASAARPPSRARPPAAAQAASGFVSGFRRLAVSPSAPNEYEQYPCPPLLPLDFFRTENPPSPHQRRGIQIRWRRQSLGIRL